MVALSLLQPPAPPSHRRRQRPSQQLPEPFEPPTWRSQSQQSFMRQSVRTDAQMEEDERTSLLTLSTTFMSGKGGPSQSSQQAERAAALLASAITSAALTKNERTGHYR